MAEITDKELEALQDGFDTLSLIHAVDELDKMRGHLNDREHHNPPEIRNDILKGVLVTAVQKVPLSKLLKHSDKSREKIVTH